MYNEVTLILKVIGQKLSVTLWIAQGLKVITLCQVILNISCS